MHSRLYPWKGLQRNDTYDYILAAIILVALTQQASGLLKLIDNWTMGLCYII